jgi:hypothetical protein
MTYALKVTIRRLNTIHQEWKTRKSGAKGPDSSYEGELLVLCRFVLPFGSKLSVGYGRNCRVHSLLRYAVVLERVGSILRECETN